MTVVELTLVIISSSEQRGILHLCDFSGLHGHGVLHGWVEYPKAFSIFGGEICMPMFYTCVSYVIQ